jgi:flagellar motor protein MotB
MTDTKPSLDEQIANVKRAMEACEKSGFPPYEARAILASLERIKQIESAEMPVEPEFLAGWRNAAKSQKEKNTTGQIVELVDYIDDLKSVIQRKEGEAREHQRLVEFWKKSSEEWKASRSRNLERAESLARDKAEAEKREQSKHQQYIALKQRHEKQTEKLTALIAENGELLSIIVSAFESFKVAQSPSSYPSYHWSRKAEAAIYNAMGAG